MTQLVELGTRARLSFLSTMAAIDNPRGWSMDRGGSLAVVTGVNLSFANGVWVRDPHADLDECESLLEEVLAHGVPCVLEGRECQYEQLQSLAARHQMERDEASPLMVLSEPPRATRMPVGLTIRELGPTELDVHALLAATVFDLPVADFLDLMSLSSRYPGIRVLVGEVGGEVVTTALTLPTAERTVGVFNVVTTEEHRGRGYGSAITDAGVRAAMDTGAQWAWLQSSPDGFNAYSRLGFRTVERRPLWSRES